MRKKSILGLIIFVLFVIDCKRAERSSSVKTELINGIPHVFNAGKPIRGKISLEVTEVLRIDPQSIDREQPPLFGMAVKDDTGNLYLRDQQKVRVYKFDSGGKLLAQFLSKGQGPAIASTSSLVAADIHHAYDRDSGAVFVCNNSGWRPGRRLKNSLLVS